jgi:hypothetical protein
MQTLQFEGTKHTYKQNRGGHVLELSIHPDNVPEPLLRDFTGARYQTVLVKTNSADMLPLNFECMKVGLKQDKNGYVIAFSLHPDDAPSIMLQDAVGTEYQVVMVRLDSHDAPIDRQDEFSADRAIRISGMLCRDPKFWDYLYAKSDIATKDYETVTQWLRFYLDLESRSQLKTNIEAQNKLDALYREYTAWKPTS